MMSERQSPELANQRKNARHIAQTNWILLIMAFVTCVVVVVVVTVSAVKIDGKVSHIDQTTSHTRQAQMANTKVSNTRSNCQDKAFNDILAVVQLVLKNDHNAADYPKPFKC
jgi:hypothetical protein